MPDTSTAPKTYELERLFEAAEARASLLTLAPGQYVPLHHHSDVTDFMFVVDGLLTVEFRNGVETRSFAPGQRCTIRPGVAHSTRNRGSAVCRVLLVQVGRYDFLPVPEDAP